MKMSLCDYNFSIDLINKLIEVFKKENPKGQYRVVKNMTGNVLIEEEEGGQRLYLRPFPKHTLTVAHIQTLRNRQGIGKAIFECLEQYAKEQGCSRLVIEQAMTADVIRFAQKENFVLDGIGFSLGRVLTILHQVLH